MMILEKLVEQSKNPTGVLGTLMLRTMNKAHRGIVHTALGSFSPGAFEETLDIGCGGGVAIDYILRANLASKVHGMDRSPTSIDLLGHRLRIPIDTGKVRLHCGDVIAMPFPDRTFGLITAFQTHYYWEDLPGAFREVRRVLKDNGKFVLAAEVFKMKYHMQSYQCQEEYRGLLNVCGLREVSINVVRGVMYCTGIR